MKKINAFINNRGTLELLVSLFAIAGTVLYVQRPLSLPLVFRATLWLLIICAVLAVALKFWMVIAERKSNSRLSENEPRVGVDWWASIAGIIAVVITGSLLRNLAIPFVLVVFFAAMAFYYRSLRRENLARLSVITTALLYAVTLALLVVYLRSASGFISPQEPLDPQFSAIPSAYFAVDSTLSVYNKSHIRLAAIQFILFSGAFSFLLLAFQGIHQDRRSWFRNPYAPAAMLVVLAATLPVPPFGMDGAHWTHWIGPSLALLDGEWPYFDVFSYYGLLPIIILSGWTLAFGASPISLAILLSILAFLSAMIVYALIARHGRSHLAAFVGATLLILLAYNHQALALPTPNHSALRFHFFIALVLWTAFEFFVSLKQEGRHAYWYAFLLGILTTWGPSDGLFVLIGMTLVLGLTGVRDAQIGWRKVLSIYATYVAGILALPLVAIVTRGGLSGTIAAVKRIVDFLSIFSQGYGNFPQYFDASLLLMFVMMVTLVIYCVRFVILNRVINPKFAFCIFSLILSTPYLLQAISRLPVTPNGFLWVVLPGFLILVARPLRFISHQTSATKIVVIVVALTSILALVNPVKIFIHQMRQLTVGQESGIQLWAQRCAADKVKGVPCESVRPFTLAGLYSKEKAFSFVGPSFSRMVDECRAGTLIVDTLDAFVYMAGNCRPHHPYQSFFSVSTKKQATEYLEILSNSHAVYFGSTHFDFQQRLSDQLKESWLARHRALSTCDAAKANTSEFVASGLSDATRSRGIELSDDPSILLDTDRGILCYLQPGTRLLFTSSGERVVRDIEGNIIRLTGQALDPIKDGYPNRIRIIGR